ncbi:MAG TPA: N-acetylmuramoyl-L-alanine amidase [Streptomyces sp.]|nr:N-acetylmuramoyl-L-alanine amidase [Streptomyces sp.]
MATPLTADQILKALKAEGVRVREHRSWRTHNRNHKGPWGPVHGVGIHHTAGVSSGMVDFCYNGNANLPGPLCHAVLTKAAAVHLVGHGRTNHFGTIARNAFTAAYNEAKTHPRPDSAEPVDGNRHFYGLEIENRGDGKDPYPDDQHDQAVRYAAAICRAHGWNEHSVIGHKEATRRKIDPSFDMDRFRAAVGERLKHPPSWSPGTAAAKPAPSTPQKKEIDVKLNDEVKIGQWVMDRWPDDAGLQDGSILVQTALGSGYAHARTAADASRAALAQLGAMQATIDKLVDHIGASGGLTAAEIRAAAEAGAKAALDRLGDALKQEG